MEKIKVTWDELKTFYTANKATARMSYLDFGDYYVVWVEYRTVSLVCYRVGKGDVEGNDFETSYMSISNVNEATPVRITTNKMGRKLHDRYITFTTASYAAFDNTDWRNDDYGDLAYMLKDANGNSTTDGTLAMETWLDWEPHWDFEIAGGWLWVPEFLPGDLDAWEAHVLGVPDIPASMGGEIPYIANPRLKWIRGKTMIIDAMLNPAEMKYNSTYHTNKIRFIIKHPLGLQCEMQLNIKVFR